jgi:hypothetical protein
MKRREEAHETCLTMFMQCRLVVTYVPGNVERNNWLALVASRRDTINNAPTDLRIYLK